MWLSRSATSYGTAAWRFELPAPDLFLFAADHLVVNPSRYVVSEDSPYGVQAARTARTHASAHSVGMVPVRALAVVQLNPLFLAPHRKVLPKGGVCLGC